MLPTENWRMGFDERFPIYQQIIGRFSRALVNGEVAPGERILSIRDMAVALKVNTNTVQRAYQELERENLIYSQRGTGYFVMEDANMIERIKHNLVKEATTRFLQEMRELGFAETEILATLQKEMKGGENNGAVDHQRA